jgi:hypothetical protein
MAWSLRTAPHAVACACRRGPALRHPERTGWQRQNCIHHGQKADGYINYVEGANVAGLVKVADAMLAQGVI